METRKIERAIPYPYNPGEYRLSKLTSGPRGGKKWQTIYSQPATGGSYRTVLEVGATYKETYWTNGFPRSSEFIVKPGPDQW
jgi:hypothetical protein